MNLTKILLEKMPRGGRQKVIVKAWKGGNVDQVWASSASAKKAAQLAVRKELSDFDRFKVMVLKQRRSRVLSAAK